MILNTDRTILRETLANQSPPANLTLDIFEYTGTKVSGFTVRFYASEFEELPESKKELYIEWLKGRLTAARKLMRTPVVIEKGE